MGLPVCAVKGDETLSSVSDGADAATANSGGSESPAGEGQPQRSVVCAHDLLRVTLSNAVGGELVVES